jgi:aryl-alcohol dehydrogenase-like predicted oxidoreductase
MEARPLGRTGLVVPRLGLDAAEFGGQLDDAEAAVMVAGLVDAGGSLLAVAGAAAEEALSRICAGRLARRELLLVVRAGGGGSRRALVDGLDTSLHRLGTDRIDLWLLPAYDPATPVEETLGAADGAVASGRVHYVGAAGYTGWQLAKAASWQRARSAPAQFAAVSVGYSLADRSAELDLLPAAVDLGVGVIATAPLGAEPGGGRPPGSDPGGDGDRRPDARRPAAAGRDRLLHAVHTAADGLGMSDNAVLLGWLLGRPGVAAALVAPRGPAEQSALLGAVLRPLPAEIRAALDEVSGPAGPERLREPGQRLPAP